MGTGKVFQRVGTGKVFQRVGPATEKALDGDKNIFEYAERR